MKVVIFGRGKVGRTLARLLRANDVAATLKAGRAPLARKLAPDQIFILAVPDAEIASCARRLAPHVTRHSVVFHCAGARTRSELDACAERGASVAGFHPLVSFASARSLTTLRGTTFVCDGKGNAARAARALTRTLGARCVFGPVLGPAYHAAAALTANGGAALTFSAQQTLVALGLGPRDAARALAALLHSVASNIADVGLPEALTGPVVRGDGATVQRHIAALEQLSPALAADYRAVQPVIASCARAALQTKAAKTRRTRRQRQR